MGRGLVGNLQFLAAVDDITGQSVQADDFLIPGTVTEVLRGNLPEGIAVNNNMDSVIFRVDQSALAVKHAVARIGIRALLCVGQNLVGTFLGLGVCPGLADTVNFRFGGFLRWGGFRGDGAKSGGNPRYQIAETAVEPVARTGFVGKPAVDSQHHLIRFRRVVQRLGLVRKPEQLFLAIALADVGAEFNKGLIDFAVHGVGRGGIAGALDGDRTLVILPAGRTPGAVLLLHTERNPAIRANAVVAAGLTVRADEAVADAFSGGLSHNAVGRDPVNAVRSLTRVVGAEFGVCHQRAVGIGHY